MTDNSGNFVDGKLSAAGEVGDRLTARVVKAQRSAGGTGGDGSIPSAAEENVERLPCDCEDGCSDPVGGSFPNNVYCRLAERHFPGTPSQRENY